MTIWKTIPGFSFYQVSEFGDVRRDPNKRMRGWGPTRPPGGLLHPNYKDKIDRYLVVNLKNDEGKTKSGKIHRLVCLGFHGLPPSAEHCALHKNDDKQNNHFTNLYWGTKKQNAIDRERNAKSGTACLSYEEVLYIKELRFADRRSIDELAEIFEVKPCVIRCIITGKTYAWVRDYVV